MRIMKKEPGKQSGVVRQRGEERGEDREAGEERIGKRATWVLSALWSVCVGIVVRDL